MKAFVYGKSINFGQCQNTFEGEKDYFCFVDELSVCPKIPSNLKSGTFISTTPCKDLHTPIAKNGTYS